MRQYFLSLTSAATLLLLLNLPAFAQDDKEKDKDKDKLKQYDEIIIRKKTDKDGKVTVEIKDGEVTVNGKPLEDFEDEHLSVRKRKSGAIVGNGYASPFRNNSGGWNFNNDHLESFGFGDSKTAFLGVATGEGKEGAEIKEVTKGSAAEKAGLKKGDVITKVGDKAVFSQDDVSAEIRKHKPEDKVTITYKRDGKENKATATLGKRPGGPLAFSNPNIIAPNIESFRNFDFKLDDGDGPRVFLHNRPRLGIKAQDTEDGKGVKVLEVDDESIAEKSGVKENDIITEFDGKPVNSADELAAAARDARDKASVTVKLNRGGKTQTLELKTPKKLKTAIL